MTRNEASDFLVGFGDILRPEQDFLLVGHDGC